VAISSAAAAASIAVVVSLQPQNIRIAAVLQSDSSRIPAHTTAGAHCSIPAVAIFIHWLDSLGGSLQHGHAATSTCTHLSIPARTPHLLLHHTCDAATAFDAYPHLTKSTHCTATNLLLQVRRPAPGRLQVRPFCRMWDSANYCNQHQPDFLGSSSDNSCGSATINSSHIAQYTQCTLGGGSCQTFKGR
jgi:hypothetical protein